MPTKLPDPDFGLSEEDWGLLGLPLAQRMSPKTIAKMQRLQARASEDDPAILALPHPQRSRYMRHLESQEMAYGDEWAKMKPLIADLNLPVTTMIERLADLSPAFERIYKTMLRDPSGINGGSLGATFMAMRFAMTNGAMFQTTDELDEMLANTDIADDIPIGMIRAPFPACYFEFGESRQSPLRVWNDETGNHVAEGCYLFEYEVDRYRDEPMVPHRHLLLVQTGAPKANIGDDALQLFTIPILDEGASINETIENYIKIHHAEVDAARSMDPTSMLRRAPGEAFEQAKDFLRHLLKILLYLSTDDHTQRRVTEGSDALKALAAIKSTAKRNKAERRADKAYDRILLGHKRSAGPEWETTGDSAGTGRKLSKVGWRRGHFRNQAYGEGWKLRRTKWIKPTLVKGDALSDAPAAPKPYVIR